MRVVSFIVSAALLASVKVYGQPTDEVNWLMNEPASLFDLGMYNLNRELEQMDAEAFPRHSLDIRAKYVWDRNTIFISFSTIRKNLKTIEAGRRWCITIIEHIKDRIGSYELNDGSLGYSMNRIFEHEGYYNKHKPEELGEHLTSITQLIGFISIKDLKSVVCKAGLGEGVIQFED